MGLRAAPAVYAFDQPPPGVRKRFLDADIVASRPFIVPRGKLLHTNGASRPASLDAIYNWANQRNSNTKPQIQAQRDGSADMLLPFNRKGIANYRAAGFFTAIETQDLGWGAGKPGGAAGYTPEQADTIAASIAYLHITCEKTGIGGFPLTVPTAWDGTGVGSHTDPFAYPYWTNSVGKACPGYTKKDQLRTLILPLAREYVTYWTKTPQEDTVPTYIVRSTADGSIHVGDGIWRNYHPDAAATERLLAKRALALNPILDWHTNKAVSKLAQVTSRPPAEWADALGDSTGYAELAKKAVDDQGAQLDRIEAKTGNGGGGAASGTFTGTFRSD